MTSRNHRNFMIEIKDTKYPEKTPTRYFVKIVEERNGDIWHVKDVLVATRFAESVAHALADWLNKHSEIYNHVVINVDDVE